VKASLPPWKRGTNVETLQVPPLGGKNTGFPAEAGTTNEIGSGDNAFLNTPNVWLELDDEWRGERPGGVDESVHTFEEVPRTEGGYR